MWHIFPFFVVLFVVGLGYSIPGGVQDINQNDPEFQSALEYALNQWNFNSPYQNKFIMRRVIKAQIQVVSGANYIMILEMGMTFCPKKSLPGFCPVITSPDYFKTIYCWFTVWDRPWLKLMELTNSRCQDRYP